MIVERGQPKGATGAVLKMMNGILNLTKPKYCYPPQLHMLELLESRHGLDIARSTLNLWLNWLEDEKWVKRYPGSIKPAGSCWINRPSRYYLTRKALYWLISIGKKVKSSLWQGLKPQLFQGVRKTIHDMVNPKPHNGSFGSLPFSIEGFTSEELKEWGLFATGPPLKA